MPSNQGEPAHFGATIAATGVSQTLLAENQYRRYLIFKNQGPATIFVRFHNSTAAIAGQPCIEIKSGEVWNPDPHYCPTQAIQVIGTIGTQVAGLWGN